MKTIISIFKFAALVVLGASYAEAQTSVRIGLQASNGQWVCAELIGSRAVVANRGGWGPWEHLNVRDFNGGPLSSGDTIALQSADGRFICAEQGGNDFVIANRNGIGDWEQFTIERLAGPGAIQDGDYVALRSFYNYYVRAEGGGGGAVKAVTTGIGSWEAFQIWFASAPEETGSTAIDVNGDGIADEIVKPDTYRFNTYIANWYTYCYDYWSYAVNDYFFPWTYNFGPSWTNDPTNFGSIWYPDLFWSIYSIYSYCDTYVEPVFEFVTEAFTDYRIYEDRTGSGVYNPANWQLAIAVDGFGTGVNTVYLGAINANDAYAGQFYLVKLGKQPPAGGFDESQLYSGAMTLPEFANYAMDYFDAGAKDMDAFTNPDEYDSLEEVISARVREKRNAPPIPKHDMFKLLRRIYVVYIIIEVIDQWPMSYVVYRKWDAINDKAYIGRTSGAGDAWTVTAARDAKTDVNRVAMNFAGYKPADVHSWVTTYGVSDFGYFAHRGREQMVMDNYEFFHNKKSPFNSNRGVRANNINRWSYYQTSNIMWPSICFFTGDPPGSHVGDFMFPVLPDKLTYNSGTIQPNAGL